MLRSVDLSDYMSRNPLVYLQLIMSLMPSNLIVEAQGFRCLCGG